LSKEAQWRSGTKEERLATLDGLGRPSMPFVHCWRCAPDKGLSRRMGCRGTYSCQYVVEVTSSGGKRIMAHVLDRMPRSNRKPNEASAVWSSWQAFSTGLTLPARMGSDRRKPPLAAQPPSDVQRSFRNGYCGLSAVSVGCTRKELVCHALAAR